MAVAEKLTIEDFERLPDALAINHELDDGELVDVSGNSPEHNILRDFLLVRMHAYVSERHLGLVISETEFGFGENAHGPDISFLGRDKVALLERRRRVQPFVPDLAVEVVSKNDTFRSIVRKANRYVQYGTGEVWVFDIENREVYFYSPGGKRILGCSEAFETPLIPGFRVPLSELFG